MIRSFAILFAALFTISAQATPKLGDYALFDATLSLNGQTATGTVQQEIVKFDAAKNEYLERQTVNFAGQGAEVTDEWKPATDYLDDATIDAILANCQAAGGTLQTISVPAGSFNTCAMPFHEENNSGVAYITKVPFGVARIDSTQKDNGVTIGLQLKTFR